MRLKFGQWLPDLADFENPGSTVVKNVIPFNDGNYLPLRSFAAISDAIDARCRGAVTARDSTGTVYSYAGNATKLYSLSGNAHTDASNGVYSLGDEENWEFAKWGETIIAVNINTAPQDITFGNAAFADLGGSPPNARHITIVNNFVVLGNINDGTERPQRVRWSGINNSETWTPDADTQADFQDLFSETNQGGGWIMGLTGGEYGNVFQEYSIWRMTYVGSPLIFQFDEVLPGVGTPAKNSIVQEGRITHFLGQDGFYQLVDGAQVNPIGKNKVDRYFYNDLNTDFYERVIGAQDPSNNIVAWIYPSTESTTGVPDKVIFYDYLNDKWGNGEVDLEWIYNALSQPLSPDSMDALYGSPDNWPFSPDSRALRGGDLQLGLYNTSNVKGIFGGTALDATIETPEAQLFTGARALVDEVRPLVDGGATLTVQCGHRNSLGDTVTWDSAVSPNADTGLAPTRCDDRYHRLRINTSGDFNEAIGVDIQAQQSGRR